MPFPHAHVPVQSKGHVDSLSSHCGWQTPLPQTQELQSSAQLESFSPHSGSHLPLPHRQLGVHVPSKGEQMVPGSSEQSTQASPSVPHAVSDAPVTHFPFASQQPSAHVVGPHLPACVPPVPPVPSSSSDHVSSRMERPHAIRLNAQRTANHRARRVAFGFVDVRTMRISCSILTKLPAGTVLGTILRSTPHSTDRSIVAELGGWVEKRGKVLCGRCRSPLRRSGVGTDRHMVDRGLLTARARRARHRPP
jgi:hypothetical protein